MSMFMFPFPGETTSFLSKMKHSLFLLISFFIVTLFLFKWLNRTSRKLPPSPPKLPIIGNLHQLGFLPHRSLKLLAEKYGPLMLLHLGSKPTLIISSPQVAKMVLKTHDLDFANRPKLKFIGRILYNFKNMGFSPYGEYWRQVRSICVSQLLSNKSIQSFRSVREEEIALLMEKVTESCVSRSSFNISEMLATLANNIISRIVIGKRLSGEKSGSNFKKMYEEFSEILGSFNVGDYTTWLGWINHINGLEAKVNRIAKEIDEYFENIVEGGMERREEALRYNGERDEFKGQHNFLDVLLELQSENTSGYTLHRDSIKAIIFDMFVGGTDTVAALLEWAICELVINKDAMTKLRDEVRRFSISKLNCITEDDLKKLPYLKAVIKETLRMHPPGPLLLPRESRNAVKIMGYDISSGTQVLINAFAIGRDSTLWQNPDAFSPDRFLNSSIDVKGHNFELIPFGHGRRSCPGA
ncbi:OLC1v1030439C2 [Oldenlandia corymbosa var. corymbosa]|uniref:OLC1v1030439C2 n=1 Tax=Oldenlandia corymbosa var. corymbosa TaxID=529605 RepID=A0AAV1CGT0_OLDCO|nr:OLC1v1030439C2 [Oldenlandia corymbosa var. corymbosa]